VFSPPPSKKGKEVKQYMKRVIKVLVVSALMMVLMATTVSPAFASSHCKNGWGGMDKCGSYPWKTNDDGDGPATYGFGGDDSWKVDGPRGYGARDK
jgi:hypothetical protein